MKRNRTYTLAAILVLAAAAALAIIFMSSKDHDDKQAATPQSQTVDHSTAFPKRQACSIFTLANAKQVLGDSAKGGQSTGNSSSGDLDVSTCTYTQPAASLPVSASKAASLLVRVPKSGAGTTSNQNQFGPLKPSDSQPVTGYGDNAYWSPQYGQLNILKNNTWYILSYGPVMPASRTLDHTKQLADLLINKM